MNITGYIYSGEPNRINKELELAFTFTGKARNECSVLNPTILVESGNISAMNYFYISDFGRYYYVTELTCVREGVWAISGHVDVLMTYAGAIGSCPCIFSRAENKQLANLYLPDDRLNITSKQVIRQNFLSGGAMDIGEPSMILTVAG